MLKVIGLDIGQVNDATAAVGLEVVPTVAKLPYIGQDPETGILTDRTMEVEGPPCEFLVRDLTRFPLGMEYPAIIDATASIVRRVPGATLVVDQTGVGRPIYDALVSRALAPIGVTIVGGATARWEGRQAWVPKGDLISGVQLALEQRRMRFAGKLVAVEQLIKELLSMEFKVSIAGNVQYGAWREGTNDDLVLALAIAAWFGEQEYGARAQALVAATQSDQVTALHGGYGGISPY